MLLWSRSVTWIALSLALAGAGVAYAQTQTPPAQARTQVPGYYRMALGTFEVTALYDGEIKLDTKLLKNAKPGEIGRLLARMFRENPTPTAVIAYLVHTGKNLVLVDAGAAKLFGPTLGNVLGNLKAAGYDPAQVDTVLLTHLHADHVGGLRTPDGQMAFPNARVHASKADADFWLSADSLAKAPEGAKGFFKMAQSSLEPYIQTNRFKTFTSTDELLPGIRPVVENGHTPGHSGYLFESGGKKLLIWGDVVHNAAVQFAQPKVTIEFDSDPKQALATRLSLFKWTAKDALLVAGMHHPFPGIGQVRADGGGRYTWVPIDFAPMPAP